MDYLDYFLHLTWTMVKMKRWLQGWVLSVMEFKCSYKHKIIPTFEDTAKCRLLLLFKWHGKKKMEAYGKEVWIIHAENVIFWFIFWGCVRHKILWSLCQYKRHVLWLISSRKPPKIAICTMCCIFSF